MKPRPVFLLLHPCTWRQPKTCRIKEVCERVEAREGENRRPRVAVSCAWSPHFPIRGSFQNWLRCTQSPPALHTLSYQTNTHWEPALPSTGPGALTGRSLGGHHVVSPSGKDPIAENTLGGKEEQEMGTGRLRAGRWRPEGGASHAMMRLAHLQCMFRQPWGFAQVQARLHVHG